jgi:hypothetical protein
MGWLGGEVWGGLEGVGRGAAVLLFCICWRKCDWDLYTGKLTRVGRISILAVMIMQCR